MSKTITHPFTLDLYHTAKANPDKYRFVYRDGTYPLGAVWMEGVKEQQPIISWVSDMFETHSINGFYYLEEDSPSSKDLFIEEIVPRTRAEIEAEIAALQEELKKAGGEDAEA